MESPAVFPRSPALSKKISFADGIVADSAVIRHNLLHKYSASNFATEHFPAMPKTASSRCPLPRGRNVLTQREQARGRADSRPLHCQFAAERLHRSGSQDTVVNSGSEHHTEDMRVLSGNALDTENLIRIVLRCSLIDSYRREDDMLVIKLAGTVLKLTEHDARVFMWGLVRGRERTLAQQRR